MASRACQVNIDPILVDLKNLQKVSKQVYGDDTHERGAVLRSFEKSAKLLIADIVETYSDKVCRDVQEQTAVAEELLKSASAIFVLNSIAGLSSEDILGKHKSAVRSHCHACEKVYVHSKVAKLIDDVGDGTVEFGGRLVDELDIDIRSAIDAVSNVQAALVEHRRVSAKVYKTSAAMSVSQSMFRSLRAAEHPRDITLEKSRDH